MGKFSFDITMISYLVSSVGYFTHMVYRRHGVFLVAAAAVGVGFLFHTLLIVLRSIQTGHGPYTTAFEVAAFFAWVLVVIYLITEWKFKVKNLGAFVIPVVFLIIFYAAFLSQDVIMVEKSDTMFWLTLHRTLSILGYSAFAIAFAAAIMYLIQENQVKSKKLGSMYFRMPSLEVLDDLNYKVISVGFPLFTLGFLTGAIWNFKMHQNLFAWDVTRTWPLVVVWLIYCLVFFGRFITGLRGKKAAQGAIVGFIAIILTYFLHV